MAHAKYRAGFFLVLATAGCSGPADDRADRVVGDASPTTTTCALPSTYIAVRREILDSWMPAGIGMDAARVQFAAQLQSRLRFRNGVAYPANQDVHAVRCLVELRFMMSHPLAKMIAQEDMLGAKVVDDGLAVRISFRVERWLETNGLLVTLDQPRDVARVAFLGVNADKLHALPTTPDSGAPASQTK